MARADRNHPQAFSLGSSDRLVAFAEDGSVSTFSHTTTDRQGRTPLIVSTLFPERQRFEVLLEARGRAAPGTNHVYLYPTRQKLYLLYLKPSGVVSSAPALVRWWPKCR